MGNCFENCQAEERYAIYPVPEKESWSSWMLGPYRRWKENREAKRIDRELQIMYTTYPVTRLR